MPDRAERNNIEQSVTRRWIHLEAVSVDGWVRTNEHGDGLHRLLLVLVVMQIQLHYNLLQQRKQGPTPKVSHSEQNKAVGCRQCMPDT
jgi:hypothetical protein